MSETARRECPNRGFVYLLAKRPLSLRIAASLLCAADRVCLGGDYSWRRRCLDGGRGISSGWFVPLWNGLERREWEFVDGWCERYERGEVSF